MIKIVAEGDTFVLRSAFCVLRFYRSIGTINRNLRKKKPRQAKRSASAVLLLSSGAQRLPEH